MLQIARGLLMHEGHYSLHYWLYLIIWSVLMCVGGMLFFWVAEERYGRD